MFRTAAALLLGFLPAAAMAAEARPNIVFVIADDWSFPHAGAYGDPVVKTPNFDRVASEGVLLTNSYCASPSCTPSRGAILSGQAVHRLGPAGNLWSSLPREFVGYPDLLAKAGYAIGLTGKGWGPGTFAESGRKHNPAGRPYPNFRKFLESVPDDAPFCYWYGSTDPHRPYEAGSGRAAGMDPDAARVPPNLPDTPLVRDDILDYYAEVQRFDEQLGEILKALEESGRAGNTLVVVTSDNGMPFPRSKANLYDMGTRMPLAIRWPGKVQGGRAIDAFVSHTDFAPTFLEAAGLDVPAEMTGRSLLPLLQGQEGAEQGRDAAFTERERHANVRRGDLSYPARAIRTADYLYIQNLRPDRWPAGDPEGYHSVGPFGDIDGSPTKDLLLERRDDPQIRPFFELACSKRPAEELYSLRDDPGQIRNLADDPTHAEAKARLRERLMDWRERTGDPLLSGDDEPFDTYSYHGPPGRRAPGR